MTQVWGLEFECLDMWSYVAACICDASLQSYSEVGAGEGRSLGNWRASWPVVCCNEQRLPQTRRTNTQGSILISTGVSWYMCTHAFMGTHAKRKKFPKVIDSTVLTSQHKKPLRSKFPTLYLFFIHSSEMLWVNQTKDELWKTLQPSNIQGGGQSSCLVANDHFQDIQRSRVYMFTLNNLNLYARVAKIHLNNSRPIYIKVPIFLALLATRFM